MEKIAKIFNDNLSNRLTVELANGMFSAIQNIINEELQEEKPEIKAEDNVKSEDS